MLYRQIEQNKRKTVLLVLLFSLLVLATGAAIGYLGYGDAVPGVAIAAVFLAFYVPVTYLSATAQVLRIAGARPASREAYPQLYRIVEELCIPARLPMPRIYVVDDPSPNAFATGMKPDKGTVAFTTGLLERLNREELEGVAAHELAHIRNYDIRLMTLSIALVSVIIVLADIGPRLLSQRHRGRGKKNASRHPDHRRRARHPGTYCGPIRAFRDFAKPGVFGGCDRGGIHPKSGGPPQRADQNRRERSRCAERQAGDGGDVHRQPVRQRAEKAANKLVQHASFD